jgi:hypothetical protein
MQYLNKTILLAAMTIMSLAGCASKVSATFTSPEIGVVATQGIGEELLMQGTGELVPHLTIFQDEVIGVFTLRKGHYAFDSENSMHIEFERDNQDLFLIKADKKICIDKISKKQCASVKYSLAPRLANESEDSFQQTLLYNGKIGTRITLGYREFVNDLARPAFSNEVTYDLSESTTLGYKGAIIEIVKATNTEITYKILSGFK